MLNFEQIEQLPKDTVVEVPVFLNTQGKELNSLQIRINIEGEVENLQLNVGSKIPIQEIARKIDNNSVFVSLTSLELTKTWSTTEPTELLSLSFIHRGDGQVKLSFDETETLAASNDSEENVLIIGEDVEIKIGEVVPMENKETNVEISEAPIEEVTNETNEGQSKEILSNINNNLLIGIMIISFIAALLTFLYMLKSQKKEKTKQEPKIPLN